MSGFWNFMFEKVFFLSCQLKINYLTRGCVFFNVCPVKNRKDVKLKTINLVIKISQ